MANLHTIPTAATPIERILSRFDRAKLEAFITVAIELLDAANDPDLEDDDPPEANGDELDGINSEDDFWPHSHGWKQEAGCPISDPGGCEHDGREPEDHY